MYLFDMDGTLIDSNDVWKDVDREFLARRGLPYTKAYYEGVAAVFMGENANVPNARAIYGQDLAPIRRMDQLSAAAGRLIQTEIRELSG